MLLKGRPSKTLLQSEILAAQSISKTEAEVSRRLGVSFMTYRKYAKMYGVYGRVANESGRGISKARRSEDNGKYPLNHILDGKYPNYSTHRLKVRLIRSKRIEQKCAKCGFYEARLSDNAIPLLLNYKDGNPKNKKLENLELLCYNHFFLNVNNPFGRRKTFIALEAEATKDIIKKDEIIQASGSVNI